MTLTLKKTKFSIDGTNHAYYEVTYTDGSTSGKVEAPNLKIKQVEEYSRGATLDSITVVDNVIKGQLAGDGPFDGIKVQIILKLSDAVKDSYCDGGKCSTDKDTSKPVDATVNGKTGEFTYTIPNPDLKLDQAIGVTVKEPHKFKSCSKTTVKPAKVGKTEVRDPRKLTDPEKKAIDTAIRKTYTVIGESKLPTGNPDRDGLPAVIQIDDSGNAKIFSPNDVAGTWDPNNDYAFVPETNEDGSYKIKDGSEPVITIPAKDLVKNIKPKAPTPALSEDKKNITFTPNEKDTDAKIITVSYKDKDGNDQTTTATKDDNGTWSITEGQGNVDANGVITLDVSNVKGGTKVTATVSDKGGIADDDKEVLTSDESELQITKAILVEALGGLSPVNMKKWVGDDLDWKDGVKAKDDAKKDEVEELLKGAKFEDVTEEKRNTSKEGDFEGKIKITFDDKSELVVEKQMLYVNNHVTSMERKDKVPTDALDVEFKLGEGTKVDNTGSGEIEGNKDNPTSYAKYKVKPNTNLKEYKIPAINTSAVDSINVTPQEGYIDPVWRDIKNGTNFVATTDNNVFTATATKTFKVTVQPNGGTGDDKVETKKSGEKYTLPKGDTFTPPENKEFAGWLVGDATTTTAPGTEITITGDTVIKASWKPIEFTVKFQTEAGASGEMKEQTVAKGNKYELPKPTFTPNKGKEFAGWKVGDSTELKKTGDEIDISGDVTLTATWKDIEYKVIFDGNKGSGTMTGATVKKGEKYKLPDNSFGAPSDKQEFKTWEVDGKEVAPGTEITIDKDTEVKAIWKDIEYKVTFNGNTGTGSMDSATVKKGEKYKLPNNSFGAPSDKQEFKAWEVDGKEVAPGTEITIDKDTEVKAIWKDKPAQPNPGSNPGDTPGTNPGSNPGYYPDYDPTPSPNPNPNPNPNKSDDNKDKPKKPDTPTPPQPNPGKEELPVTPKPDGTQEVTPDPDKTDEVEVTVTPDGKDPEKAKVEKDKDGNWITDRPDILKVDPKTGKITVAKGVKDVRAIATLKLERGFHERYLYGYVDGTVRPEGFITRCEAAALIARLANLDMTNADKPNFPDTPSAWYNTAINAVVAKNLMFADANGNFRPQEPITRGEFARALYYIDRHNDEVAPFEDIKGHIYEAAINQAYGNGLINGYLDGTFKPDAPIQRAEATKILNKYANRGVDHDGLSLVRQDLIHFTDIDERHWAYYEIMEAANTHEYERVVSTLYETWLKIVYDTKMK